MIFISKTCWKKLFETASRKQQWLALSIEHSIAKAVSKIQIVHNALNAQNKVTI